MQKGGTRKGAGRKPSPFNTKTISFRIRPEWEQEIKVTVRARIKELKNEISAYTNNSIN